MGDGQRYASYAKVCWTKPESYWDADCAFKIFGGEHHRSLEGALSAVALEARNEISYLPTYARILAHQRQRQRERLTLPRLFGASSLHHRMA
jgi:hypothetical protein